MLSMASAPFIITFDGPAASGKGTLARRTALHFGWPHLDTGLLYRAVGFILLQNGQSPEDTAEAAAAASSVLNDLSILENPAPLRSEACGAAASMVAAQPDVRAILLRVQQDFAGTPPQMAKGAVLDGRDTGTVIAPHAMVKFFITASLGERARRRFREMQEKSLLLGAEGLSEEAVRQEMMARDARDMGRSSAPLVAAKDALTLDTTDRSIEDCMAEILSIIRPRLKP